MRSTRARELVVVVAAASGLVTVSCDVTSTPSPEAAESTSTSTMSSPGSSPAGGSASETPQTPEKPPVFQAKIPRLKGPVVRGNGFAFGLPAGWRDITDEVRVDSPGVHRAAAPAGNPAVRPYLHVVRDVMGWCSTRLKWHERNTRWTLAGEEAGRVVIAEPIYLGQVPAAHVQGVWGFNGRPFDLFASSYTRPCWLVHFTHRRGGSTVSDVRAMQAVLTSWRFAASALQPRPN